MSRQKETLELMEISVLITPPNENGEVRHLPTTVKLGRAYSTQAPKTERGLFDSLEKRPDEERTISISGLSKAISETDLSHYIYAIRKTLYNQSYTTRHEQENSGIFEEETTNIKPMEVATGRGKKQIERRPFYKAEIITSLLDLCKEAYGTDRPTSEQKKRMAKTIEIVHSSPVKITFPNGDTLEAPLCLCNAKYTRKEDGAVFYNLGLNPIFTGKESVTNFAQLPQRANHLITYALKERKQRRTEAHLRFMERLAMQDPSKPFRIALDNLLNYLNLSEYFKKDAKKVWGRTEVEQKEGKLWGIFQIAIDTGQLLDFPKVESRQSDGMTMFVFSLNPDYCKPSEEEA